MTKPGEFYREEFHSCVYLANTNSKPNSLTLHKMTSSLNDNVTCSFTIVITIYVLSHCAFSARTPTVQNDDDHHGESEEGVLPAVRVDGHQDRGDDEEDDDDAKSHHQLQLLVNSVGDI